MEKNIKKYIFEAAKIGIFITLFAPLVLGPFGLSFSEYPKTIYFRTAVEVVAILYLILLLIDSRYAPKFTLLTGMLLIFFAAMLISSITGFNIIRSFWGSLEGGGGLVTILHYLVFFVIASGLFQTYNSWLFPLRAIVLISFVSTLAGFVQKLGIAGFYGVGIQTGRISGTLSNPVYFGFFLAMTIFLALYLAAVEKEKILRNVWLALAALEAVALFLSGGRSALLGLLLGLAITGFFYFLPLLNSRKNLRKYILIGALAISILLLLLIVFESKILFKQGSLGARFLQGFNPASIMGRFPGWETAIKAWRDRPIFGWGAESFNYLYYKYFEARYQQYIQAYYVFSDAHNEILNFMAETGMVGALSYILILVLAFAALWRGRKKMGELPTFLLISLFISYFLQNIFAFDTLSTYLVLFLVLAFVNNNYFVERRFPVNLAPLKQAIIIAFLPLAILSIYFVNVKSVLASYDTVRGFFMEQKDFPGALKYYQRAMDRTTQYRREILLNMVGRDLTVLDQQAGGQWQKEILENLAQFRPELLKSLDQPEIRYLNFYEAAARSDEWLYLVSQNKDFLREGEDISKKALAFNKQWLQYYYILGRFYIYEGDYAKGEEYFNRGYQLSLQRPQDAFEMQRIMGIVYLRSSQSQKAAEHFKNGIELKYTERMGGVKELLKQLPGFSPETIARMRQEASPEITFFEATAWLFGQLGDQNTAKDIYQKAIEVYPFYADKLKADAEKLTAPSPDQNSNQNPAKTK